MLPLGLLVGWYVGAWLVGCGGVGCRTGFVLVVLMAACVWGNVVSSVVRFGLLFPVLGGVWVSRAYVGLV